MDENERFPVLPKPRFTLVRIAVPVDVPDHVKKSLAETGVPAGLIGYEYQALPAAVHLDGPLGGHLVAFGSSGAFGRVCVDVHTGAVRYVPEPGSTYVSEVNRDVGSFTRCVAAVIDRFPFYEEDSDEEEFWRLAGELRDIVRSYDPGKYAEDGFWDLFCEDAAQGYYSDWDYPGP
ncbi:SUKH-4 family immunity protein [Actinoplanes derwentensis]|uniref:SUKH-4 immunity protein n=1 Tax=Actinoplanes derwentensis TaxID=113562 RepID=A0A1H1Z931_9ACTN|nr:SUKH-4 family immunity protein [Actinoplanes derwentensis]GID81490.1 hypothetical protein Ade03nite_04140 [Actinoplanes derwentensis]SDT30002.1 SUKH-4 immunity protein [Actinoplanes derwentensis]